MDNPLAADLDHVLDHTREVWEELRGARIFITGGTGFFGCWLLESWAWANARLNLDARAIVLTRNRENFARKVPHLGAHSSIEWIEGDVRSFVAGQSTLCGVRAVIHAATESSTTLGADAPLEMFDVTTQGTRRVLDFALRCGEKTGSMPRFLLTSSGAVYGTQPPDMTHLDENFGGAPRFDDADAAYGQGKRAAEWLCATYASRHDLPVSIARGFAFVGPYLPLDVHFAIGNFIRDALRGETIRLSGDGTPYRSYLHGADMAIWLWTILLRGEVGRAYNVGSSDGRPLREIAQVVAQSVQPPCKVLCARVAPPNIAPSRYVPSVERAQNELGLRQWIDLESAIRRTIDWHRTEK